MPAENSTQDGSDEPGCYGENSHRIDRRNDVIQHDPQTTAEPFFYLADRPGFSMSKNRNRINAASHQGQDIGSKEMVSQ